MVAVISRRFEELSAREFHDLVRLRCDVFVVEQSCAYPELDGHDIDDGTEHHWISDGDMIACCARTVSEREDIVRIGRVATAAGARGNGLAAEMVGALVERYPGSAIVLDAQSQLVEWYRQLGFAACGEEFLEDGIPHVPMELVRA